MSVQFLNPPGQFYFLPEEMVDTGTLLVLENQERVIGRTIGTRETFEFVISF